MPICRLPKRLWYLPTTSGSLSNDNLLFRTYNILLYEKSDVHTYEYSLCIEQGQSYTIEYYGNNGWYSGYVQISYQNTQIFKGTLSSGTKSLV